MAPKITKADLDKKPLNFKLLVIGDSGVGKSNIINVYVGEPFQRTFITTIGVDFKTKLVKRDRQSEVNTAVVDSQQIQDIKLNIWDTAGQERFRTITTTYYRGTQGILVVFDLSNKQSFMSIKRWLHEMEQNCTGSADVPPAIILGNKCDIPKDKWEVTEEDLADLRRSNLYYLTSAATGENLDNAFSHLTDLILKRRAVDNQKKNDLPFTTLDIKGGGGASGSGRSKKENKKNTLTNSSKCALI
ncbi:ras-related protein Rab-35-like [Symsagittifera roscoffensis]|uniref:ras-related protein Rab-35-like n=1 Tax=Symsagittifera roscoffensis TaxID=84072 RepID=UPI00307C8412